MADNDPASQSAEVGTWLSEIDRAQKAMKKWQSRCDQIRKRYRYESSADSKVRRYQMLWSNMETMKPSVMSKLPRAEVMRRFNDKDPTARVASEMLERCINVTLDTNDYEETFNQVRDDYLLYGRGQARVYYEPVTQFMEPTSTDGLDVEAVEGDAAFVSEAGQDDDGQPPEGAQSEILTYEHVKIKYIQPEDFVHSIARTWEELEWVAFRSYLDREALVKRFPDIGKTIPLDASMERKDGSRESSSVDDKATIWEIWDKSEKCVKWVAVGHPEVLEQSDPPYLTLEGFWPCPRPAYATMTNDTLEPVPDYVMYQDQAEEVDALTGRIGALQESLKVVGFYPAGPDGKGSPQIEKALSPGFENKMIAVPSWAAFQDAGKGGVPVVFMPVDQVAKVLEACIKLRQQVIEDIYQIYGLSDIMRGDGNANETATAQNIKAQFGSVRIRNRQKELARFCRDICRLVGEIVVSHFQPQTIMAMSNMPLQTDQEVQQAAMMAQLQAQQQAMPPQMMGHNGGPPMGQQMGAPMGGMA